MLAATCLDRLIEHYDGNFILIESIVAINDAILGDPSCYLAQVFEGNPSNPAEIQENLLDLYKRSGDIQYLQAYNEIAIRAQKMNQGEEIFAISSTYPKFEEILTRKGLTVEDLAIERDKLLKDLIKN